jgi:stage II sporulation protein M
MASLLGEFYRDEWAQWSAHYKRYFKIAARVLALGFILSFVSFSFLPGQEKRAFAFLMKSLRDIPLGAPPLVLALTLFYHNARASLFAMAAGGLPFLCLPVIDPLANGAALGLLASISKHQGLNVPLIFLKGVAPHGIFELPAVLYAASAGLYLSVSLGKIVLAAVKKTAVGTGSQDGGPENTAGGIPQRDDIIRRVMSDAGRSVAVVVRSFVLVVLPLLLVAAFVEAFVTPALR